MNKTFLILSIILFPSFLWAEDDAILLEDHYLSQTDVTRQIQFEVIRNQSVSDDEIMKYKALEGIERLASQPLTDEEKQELAEILADIGLYGTGITVNREGKYLENITTMRTEAARILGKLGSEPSARVLIEMLEYDNSPIVLSQCALSAAECMPTLTANTSENLREKIILQLTKTMQRQNIHDEDGHFAMGFLDSVHIISDYDHTLVNNVLLIEQILAIAESGSGYNNTVKKRAWSVLENIQGI